METCDISKFSGVEFFLNSNNVICLLRKKNTTNFSNAINCIILTITTQINNLNSPNACKKKTQLNNTHTQIITFDWHTKLTVTHVSQAFLLVMRRQECLKQKKTSNVHHIFSYFSSDVSGLTVKEEGPFISCTNTLFFFSLHYPEDDGLTSMFILWQGHKLEMKWVLQI